MENIDIFDPFFDKRKPASDIKGILADHQIRKNQLDEIAKVVDENWKGVASINVGEYDDRPYFAICIDPFSRELQIKHWALGDTIRSMINNNGSSFFYLPKMDPSHSELNVYTRK